MTIAIIARNPSKNFIHTAVFSAFSIFSLALSAHGAIIPRLNNGESLNLAAIGTSLTATDRNANNWFAQTGAWLSAKYPGRVALSNRAVTGSASVNLPDFGRPHGGTWQLDQVLTNDYPDAIFIEFAINDAYKSFNISAVESAANLKTLIDTIKIWSKTNGKNVDIIVQTMNNTGDSYAAYENDVGPYYDAWRKQAATSNVLLIDHYPTWLKIYNSEADHATWESYVPEDVHPNTLGITEVIVPEVQAALIAQAPEPSSSSILWTALPALLFFVVWKRRRPATFAN